MNLSREKFKFINLADSFFDSLKLDYKEFSEWFAKKSEDFAYVFKNEHGSIEGFLYLKRENGALEDVIPPLASADRIKVGTFKINAHGTKLGERFIKKIFDHVISEEVNEIYVTVFEKHAPLISLFERYGFERKAEKITKNGIELVLVKQLQTPFIDAVKNYPTIHLKGHNIYLLSLYPQWHTRLLPDSILKNENSDIVQDISHTNSIHKVYLAAMNGMENLKRGDILLIYRTSDGQGSANYRSVVTSICVVEEYRKINSFNSKDEFLNYCRPYSVFTEDELSDFWLRKKYPHVLRFTYNVALKKRIIRGDLINEIGLDASAYWGFMQLHESQLLSIAEKGLVNESLIVN
jgi:L-amino acid N-acyltransferase YncA